MESEALAQLVKLQGDRLEEHSKILQKHDEQFKSMKEHNDSELKQVRGDIAMLSQSIKTSLNEVNASNSYLREQNTQILNAIINDKSNQFELKKLKWTNAMKIGLALFGSGGIAYLIVELVVWLFKNR